VQTSTFQTTDFQGQQGQQLAGSIFDTILCKKDLHGDNSSGISSGSSYPLAMLN